MNATEARMASQAKTTGQAPNVQKKNTVQHDWGVERREGNVSPLGIS
jgi:hypothetical protein